MAAKDQVAGSLYDKSKRTALMSSTSQASYQVTWMNDARCFYCPAISVDDFVYNTSKVIYV
jgi:hypothetical protein